jgi:hypothetical protein
MADKGPADPTFARQAYRERVRLRDWNIPMYPAYRLAAGAENASAAVQHALDDIRRTIAPTDDPAVWHAASPWHAALYCQALQDDAVSSGSQLLFRGQRNYSWELTPTILREPDTGPDTTRNELFAAIFAAMSFNTIWRRDPQSNTSVFFTMSKQSYLAAAQHYGMHTHLLDFTTDPDVAVKFAAGDKASDDGMASVLILSLECARENGLSVILPPPFVRRLLLQRGRFVEARQTLRKDALKIREVRFPYEPGSFDVLRDGGAQVDILPRSTEFDDVIRATDAARANGATAADVAEVERVARTLKPHFAALIQNPEQTYFEYVDAFEDMLYTMVYSINADNQMYLDEERFAWLVAMNLVVSASVASVYRAVPHQYPGEFNAAQLNRMSRMVTLIDEVAADHGYDHAEAEADYRRQCGIP